jgi:hypothetical protein
MGAAPVARLEHGLRFGDHERHRLALHQRDGGALVA